MHVKVLDERVVRRAKDRGLDALVYAPHFTRLPDVEAAAERHSDDDLTVIPAREVFTGSWRNRQHVLAIGLTDPVPDFVTLDGAMDAFDRQDAAVLVPHPEFLNVSLDEAAVQRYREAIDGVEAYNPKVTDRGNRRAAAVAARQNLPTFASSYAHLRNTVGEAWTAFDRADLDVPVTAESLAAALKAGVERRIGHRGGLSHAARRFAERAHLGWENTWEKVDRLFLSGTEPTHPDHIAYDGRFDDVAVY
ncbi:PHP domain-containing protein [Halostella sp. JP-L12]|uniref:PHP-associated domain-containing protein n=1 Tax=Halostella TaxID=1843185 RepID=UPI000EF84EEA|nr:MULTISPECIES: PHP-associated domain-containing protein [Halostella]NHN47604.1 PHP domain-containing protein [Halostella sp. JP-L12]